MQTKKTNQGHHTTKQKIAMLNTANQPIRHILKLAAVIMLLTAGCATTPTPQETPTPDDELSVRLALLGRTMEHLRRNYADADRATNERMIEGAYRGMMHALDPYSEYIPPKPQKNADAPQPEPRAGVGLNLFKKDNEPLLVVSVVPGSPAAEQGIQAGDRIMELDHRVTAGLTFGECRELITGKPGTEIEMKLIRPTSENARILKLKRQAVSLPTLQPEAIRLLPDGIGYLRIDQFDAKTPAEFDQAIEQLRKRGDLRALILDLRNNPGGMVASAVELASRFLKPGSKVFLADDRAEGLAAPETEAVKQPLYDLPVVILVNRYSASASEIFAGAMQAHGRAKIIGTRTYGKGSIQRRQMLPDGGAIHYTIAYYRTPDGKVLNGVGITPDNEIPLSDREIHRLAIQGTIYPGESNPSKPDTMPDQQLAAALQSLKSR